MLDVNRDLSDADRERERVALLQLKASGSVSRRPMGTTTGMDTCDEGKANTSIDQALEVAKARKLEQEAAEELRRTREAIAATPTGNR